MEPQEVLKQALDAIEGMELPQDLRTTAFSKAVDIILLGASGSARNDSSRPMEYRQQAHDTPARNVPGDLIDRIATELRIGDTVVGRVFREDNGEPHLNLRTDQLPASKSEATREIALLIVAARHAAGLDEYTPVSEIRKEAEHFNKLDSSNFAATIRGMNQYFRVRGRSQNREVKLNQPGHEAAIALINDKGGGES